MNVILTRDKDVTIPPAALKLGGLPNDAKLEMTTLDGAVIVAKAKMTAMEYIKLLTALTAHVAQLMLTLRDACGDCRGCEDEKCPYSRRTDQPLCSTAGRLIFHSPASALVVLLAFRAASSLALVNSFPRLLTVCFALQNRGKEEKRWRAKRTFAP